ncbi:unnamed protein product, partial [Rotaria sordida]
PIIIEQPQYQPQPYQQQSAVTVRRPGKIGVVNKYYVTEKLVHIVVAAVVVVHIVAVVIVVVVVVVVDDNDLMLVNI